MLLLLLLLSAGRACGPGSSAGAPQGTASTVVVDHQHRHLRPAGTALLNK